ncbi:MAG: YbaK/EbsC family protein [Rhodospirillaceae bacterium]|jgi:prolyl-tRNA editing enzyme YbaK/EbsC (Cys-tRNA(Pro) deacylase)|nr:YbaK/EbsC family protein [Rhodospirillaceae bacterium]MBT6136908.1 YbaK/EbsC family protein [Rhodospirillaceae bacterium]
MGNELSRAAAKVERLLADAGMANRVRELDDSTRTAADAAAAIGCEQAQIAKSLIFRAKESDCAVLVVTCGANRVDLNKVATLIGEGIGKADADFVRARTGYAIGGVAPIGHTEPVKIVLDRDLLTFSEIWAAAGTPRAVFGLTPDELVSLTGGTVGDIAE